MGTPFVLFKHKKKFQIFLCTYWLRFTFMCPDNEVSDMSIPDLSSNNTDSSSLISNSQGSIEICVTNVLKKEEKNTKFRK